MTAVNADTQFRTRTGCHNTGCHNPGCPAPAKEFARGLCKNCYRVLARMIAAGIVPSWVAAEEAGLCRPRRSLGMKRFAAYLARQGTDGTQADR